MVSYNASLNNTSLNNASLNNASLNNASLNNTSLNNASLNQNPFFKLSHSSNYLYNVYKSSQFKNKSLAIANLFSHNKNRNFKELLNKLYLEFKEHEPIINKINIDSTRVNVPYEVAKSKITHILKTIFSNTQYIDNTIVEYIDANINNCSMITYENTINEQIFTFNFIIYDKTKINIKKLNNCVKAMLLFLQVIINITNNKKVTTNNKKVTTNNKKVTTNICNSNGLQLTIFMTHFVKKFELYTNKVLGALNINTGLTYPCLKTGEIYIYRKHEFFKVFIHETLHSYNVDKLLHTNYEANSNFQSLIKTFNIAPSSSSYKKIGLNEAITEFWAFIIHTFIYCYNNSTNFVKLIELFERFYKTEVNHSFFQVAKILHVNKLDYAQFLTTITKNGDVLYNEKSHVLSYIFFKSLLIYNVEKVLVSNIFNFRCDSLKLDIKINPNYPMDQLFIMLKNYSLTHNTFSLINASYTIYKKYLSLANSNKKMTSKKSHLLKLHHNKRLYKNKSHKSSSYVNYLLTNLNFMVVDYNCC
jgi:uncharacterized protein YjbI with pentapeptide repeats